jgi:hypothetical protein
MTATSPADLVNEIDGFLSEEPAHWRGPDLMMLKWRLLRQTKASREVQVDLLKEFVDRFPGDLRSRQARLMIARLMKAEEE